MSTILDRQRHLMYYRGLSDKSTAARLEPLGEGRRQDLLRLAAHERADMPSRDCDFGVVPGAKVFPDILRARYGDDRVAGRVDVQHGHGDGAQADFASAQDQLI